MKSVTSIIIAVLFLVAVSASASEVTNVTLSWSNSQTMAKIEVQGPVRFTHQTAEAADNAPFRVIVDVVSAVHELGGKDFSDLPGCPIKNIRTSQYAVTPERVVRIVFDMAEETFYKVVSDNNSILVTFPDQDGKQFAAWSTSDWLAGKGKSKPVLATAPKETHVQKHVAVKPAARTAAQLNQATENDRLASLGGPAKKTAPVVKKSMPTVPKRKIVIPTPVEGPSDDVLVATGLKVSPPTTKPAAKIVASTPKAEPKVVASTPKAKPKVVASTPKAKPKVVASTPKAKPKVVASTPKAKPKIVAATPKAKPKVVASTPKAEPKVVASTPKAKPKVVASTPKAKPKVVASAPTEKKKTSRFRRSPAMSKKIQGTLVAEFPKRLVVKYRSRGRRDPFATLINEARRANSPMEKNVPNVEGLRLVGVIESQGGGNQALFEDNNSYGYILKSGDKVRKGYVLRVESDRVYFQIFEYGWSRTIALNLEND